VVAPGWGDAVQVAKAGILEVADVFVVNKADKEGAQEAARDLRHMLKMGPAPGWLPPVILTSTVTGDGVEELWEAIEGHRKHQESTGDIGSKRRARLLAEVETMAAQEFKELTRGALEKDSDLARRLEEREIDPYRAAAILLERGSTHEPDSGS
jgi:LAO/AO transport system kinase